VSTDRDVTRIVRSWLDEGVTQLPDRVLDLVLDQVPTTPQRRASWLARRHPVVNNSIRIALVAAAVLAIALIGYQLVSGPNVGGPGPSSSQSTAPSAIATPSATPVDFGRYGSGTALTPGSYVFTHVEPLRVSFTVPSGWEKGFKNWVVWSMEDTKATLAVMTVDNLYSDPCRPDSGLRDPVVGPTVDDLATALGSVPGLTFSPPADVTLAGFAGKYLKFIPPDTLGECPAETLLWSVNGGTDALPPPTGDPDPYASLSTMPSGCGSWMSTEPDSSSRLRCRLADLCEPLSCGR
jgi:hypothetical protein